MTTRTALAATSTGTAALLVTFAVTAGAPWLLIALSAALTVQLIALTLKARHA